MVTRKGSVVGTCRGRSIFYRAILIVVSLGLFVVPHPAFACRLAPDSSWKWSEEHLIHRTERILIARYKGFHPNAKDKRLRDHDFLILDSLKGGINEAALVLMGFEPADSLDFKRDPKQGRAGLTKDCRMIVSFEVGNSYLIFEKGFHPKAYQLLAGDADPWQKQVKELLFPNPLKTWKKPKHGK